MHGFNQFLHAIPFSESKKNFLSTSLNNHFNYNNNHYFLKFKIMSTVSFLKFIFKTTQLCINYNQIFRTSCIFKTFFPTHKNIYKH